MGHQTRKRVPDMEFSEKLMQLRRCQGLSQEQLADRLGVTRQSVSKWEGGAAMPELSKLVMLSELFGVSVDYLVKDYLEEPETPEGESHTQVERLERKVDDRTRVLLHQSDEDSGTAAGQCPIRP